MNNHVDKLFGEKSINDPYGGTFMDRTNKFDTSTNKPILGSWKIRGTTAPIRYQLAYMGIDIQLVEYEMGNAPSFSQSEWKRDKDNLGLDFPDLPYFVHNEVRITDNFAIHKYVAREWAPELLGADVDERAKIAMIASVLSETYNKLIKGCYDPECKRTNLNKHIFEKVPHIVKFLGEKPFVIGKQVTWIDFVFYEHIDFMQFLTRGRFLQTFPVLDKYFTRMTKLPGLQELWHNQSIDFTAKR